MSFRLIISLKKLIQYEYNKIKIIKEQNRFCADKAIISIDLDKN
jgi:hypothetical protein